MRGYPQWRWRLNEVFVKVNGKLCYLWRAVDQEGEVLEAVVTARRDKAAALMLLKRIMKKYGDPRSIVTDGLRAYSAAMNEIGVAAERHEVGGRLNNRAESAVSAPRTGDAALSKFEAPAEVQLSSRPGAQPIQSGAPSRRRPVSSRDAPRPWPTGAPSRHRSPLARWRSRHMSTSLR